MIEGFLNKLTKTNSLPQNFQAGFLICKNQLAFFYFFTWKEIANCRPPSNQQDPTISHSYQRENKLEEYDPMLQP